MREEAEMRRASAGLRLTTERSGLGRCGGDVAERNTLLGDGVVAAPLARLSSASR